MMQQQNVHIQPSPAHDVILDARAQYSKIDIVTYLVVLSRARTPKDMDDPEARFWEAQVLSSPALFGVCD